MKELNKKIAALLFCATISINLSGCAISDYNNAHSENTETVTILNNIEAYKVDQQGTVLIENNSEHQLAAVTDTYHEFSLSGIPDYNDKPYVTVNDNIPFFNESELTTKSFESYSDLDDLGIYGVAYACIGKYIMPTEERENIGSIKPTKWQTVKYDNVDGKYLYNRYHLIGHQLSGENSNEKNLITGTRYLNVEGMLPFENITTDINETENHVLYHVTHVFEGNNLLSAGVLMEGYSVEDNGAGICFNVFCYNVQPDITLNYANDDGEAEISITTTAPVTTTTTPTTTTVTTTTTTPTTTTVTTTQTTKSQGTTYILNTNTKKFHYPGCSSVKQMKESNKKEYTGDRSDVISQGYDPCKRCNP